MRTRAVKLGSHSWAALGAVTALALCIGIVWPAPRPALAQSEGKLWQQPKGEVDRKSHGCITCHTKTDSASMHPTETVHLGCVDCHGGNPEIELSAEAAADSPAYRKAKWAA